MVWTAANVLTVGRLLFLPGILALMWPDAVTPARAFWAAILYAVAGTLDIVDGALARHHRQVTALGKFLDPLVDKLLYMLALLALLQLPGSWIPGWLVMVVLTRELAITGLRGMAVTQGITIAAGEGGKVKTTFATIGMCALLIHYPYMIHTGFGVFLIRTQHVGLFMTYLSILFSLSSACSYIWHFSRSSKRSI